MNRDSQDFKPGRFNEMTNVASALNRASVFAVLTVALVVTGCAGTNSSDEKALPPPGAPPMIYIENFDLGAATVREDPHTLTGRPRLIHLDESDPARKLDELSDLLARSLVDDLEKKNLPAQRFATDAPPPPSGWLVRGAFLEVVEGNRMQRAVIGVGGIGDSDAQLYVGVADLARPPGQQDLLNSSVDSKPGAQPTSGPSAVLGVGRIVLSHTPYGMAAHYALDRNASEHDIKRVAQRVADDLEKLVEARGKESR